MSRRQGFSLIELMIVIAIIGILVAVALPQFVSMTEDAKRAKAKNDTSEIAMAVNKFISLEGKMIESLMELKGSYMNNIDTLRDPWGKTYKLDVVKGFVYSSGPDGKHAMLKDPTWKDDIIAPFLGALALIATSLEIDPDTTTDESTAYDRLFLIFNKGVSTISTEFELGPSASAEKDRNAWSSFEDGDARAGKNLRWFEGHRPLFRPGYSPFPSGSKAAVYRTTDPRVICLAFPPGFTEVFKTTTWLNLTGAKKDPNPFFLGLDGIPGAESSGIPVRIIVDSPSGYDLIDFTP